MTQIDCTLLSWTGFRLHYEQKTSKDDLFSAAKLITQSRFPIEKEKTKKAEDREGTASDSREWPSAAAKNGRKNYPPPAVLVVSYVTPR